MTSWGGNLSSRLRTVDEENKGRCIQTMTAHLEVCHVTPKGAQVRPLVWGSVTCTAVVTVRDVMEPRVGWVGAGQDASRSIQIHDSPPVSVLQTAPGVPGRGSWCGGQ